jgi:uncharacterized phiE125 gp8 family phage protein
VKHYKQITPPTQEPISVADLIGFARAGATPEEAAEAAYIIAAARDHAEGFTGRALMLSGWRVVADGWAGGQITWGGDQFLIDRAPLVAVSSVKYYAEGETTLTTLAAQDYLVITGTEPGLVQITADLPSLADRADAVQIEFTAGHVSADLIPPTLRHAVRLLASHWVLQRGKEGNYDPTAIPDGVRHLLESQRLGGWVA